MVSDVPLTTSLIEIIILKNATNSQKSPLIERIFSWLYFIKARKFLLSAVHYSLKYTTLFNVTENFPEILKAKTTFSSNPKASGRCSA